MNAFSAAEMVRINRISAISKFSVDIENGLAAQAIAEYQKRTTTPSQFTRALGMIFTVRQNPALVPVTDSFFKDYPALHQLAMQMCKDSYDVTYRTNLVHPDTKEIAYYLTTGEVASTPEVSVYFMPKLTDTIAGPTIFVAFRGTVPPKDLLAKFGQKTGVTLFQKIAASLSRYSDLMSDMHIVLGTHWQAEAQRFDVSDKLVQSVASYKTNVILTGHSLGGVIATHCLEKNSGAVTMAIVFNPARGMDDTYFDQVEARIDNKGTTTRPQWYDKLVTHRVAGNSAKPLDSDPVSALSGGLGVTYLYIGPGVPTHLKAHASANWDTTAIGRDRASATNPSKPQ
jgi:hypothetical protein